MLDASHLMLRPTAGPAASSASVAAAAAAAYIQRTVDASAGR